MVYVGALRLIVICTLALLLGLGCAVTGDLGGKSPTSIEFGERQAALATKMDEIQPAVENSKMWTACDTLRKGFKKRTELLQSAFAVALARSNDLRNLSEAYDIIGKQIELYDEIENDLTSCVRRLERQESWSSSDFPATVTLTIFATDDDRARVEQQLETILAMIDVQRDAVWRLSMDKASGIDVPERCNKEYDQFYEEVGQRAIIDGSRGLMHRYEHALDFLSYLEQAEQNFTNCDRESTP